MESKKIAWNIETWKAIDNEIKKMIFKNGLSPESIQESIDGELNEISIKTSYGIETLFYGNGEAFITVDVNGLDYEFSYVIDTYGPKKFLVNF